MARPGPAYLPGDPSPAHERDRMVRVDHAGEYGAVRIYAGQLDVLKNKPTAPTIRDMGKQEEVHLDRFNAMIAERHVRPTVFLPFWHAAGYMLGAGTALMGERAAMACTVGVEEEIDDHYGKQLERLADSDSELTTVVEKFQAEELEHRDTALEHGAENAPAYPLLTGAVRRASRLAIWLSERF